MYSAKLTACPSLSLFTKSLRLSATLSVIVPEAFKTPAQVWADT